MLMNIYIRERLLELLKYSYPECFNKYKNFILEANAKEIKKLSNYIFAEHKIVLNSLSRSSDDIFISSIIELARHIDIINRRETHDDIELMIIIKKLLTEAVNYHLIDQKALSRMNDLKIKKKLQEIYHKFEHWNFDVKIEPTYVYIYVFEAFMIKNILKNNGYVYDQQQAAWYKKIAISEIDEEEYFTEKYKTKAIFKIIGDNSFFIRPIYYLKVKTYSKQDAPLLTALDYRYDIVKKIWSKIIIATEYKQELENIKNIPRQSLILSSKP